MTCMVDIRITIGHRAHVDYNGDLKYSAVLVVQFADFQQQRLLNIVMKLIGVRGGFH